MALSEARPSSTNRRIAFSRLKGIPALFGRYVDGETAALAFFAYDWRGEASFRSAARHTASLKRDRAGLVEVLDEQNARWKNDDPAVTANLDRLRSSETLAVVTGQQLGLFGGPLFTIYKAVTAIQLAHRCSELLERPVVPVFWLADEDHDWEEVRTAVLLRDGAPARLGLSADNGGLAVGRRMLGEEATRAVRELETVLPATEHTAALINAVGASYREGMFVRDAFGTFMASIFSGTGLVLMSADERRLKRLAAPILQREIEEPDSTLAALLAASERLAAAGMRRQVTPLAGQLFLMDEDGRSALDPEPGNQFSLRGSHRSLSRPELLRLLVDDPERISPNVVLRPVMQDYLLPSIAYVAGPGEVSYFAQLRGVYEWAGVPMPVIYPRASATLLEPSICRLLDRYGLALEDLGAGSGETLEALHARLSVGEDGSALRESFSAAAHLLDRAADVAAPVASEVDPTLARSAEAMRMRLSKELGRLEKKVVRALKRDHHKIGADLRRIAAHLYPFGRQQERVLSPIHFLNRFGPGFIELLLDELDVDTGEHQVIVL